MEQNFDVIIIGGSYAGLSAAMALGRSLRNVLVIDSGRPCNRQTPYSHNFITQDGKKPKEISDVAKAQVLKYETVTFHDGLVVKTIKKSNGFEVETDNGKKINAKKIILASGVKDVMPDIDGFAECWGISVIHCPYCHGYEVKNQVTGIIANGDTAFDFTKLIFNLTQHVVVLTNGKSSLNQQQIEQFNQNKIDIIEDEIAELFHENGQIQSVILKNGKEIPLQVLYAKIPYTQNIDVNDLGIELSEKGLIKINDMHKTNIPGVFSCGDNSTVMRSVASAVAQGNYTGTVVNRELSEEGFMHVRK